MSTRPNQHIDPPEHGASPASMDLETIYRKHGIIVFRRALTMLGSHDEASEVVQEIFLSLVREPERFHGRSSITTWLYRVTTNICINRMRDQRNRARLLAENVASLPEEAPARTSTFTELRQVIARMPEELATVLVYHVVDGMTHQEIAALVGYSRRHVGNLIRRALLWASSQEATR